MPTWLKTAGAFLLTLALSLAAVFSARAKQAKAERDQAKQQADIATEVNEIYEDINHERQATAEKHRTQKLEDEASLARGDRNQLDDHW